MVAQSDLPYLMDVVTFLGAELVLADKLVEKKNLENKISNSPSQDGLIVEVNESAARVIEIGSVPYVDGDVEMVARLLEDDTDLQSGKKSMEFSLGPYYKTRPAASKQGVKKSKDFIDNQCGGQQKLIGCVLSLFGGDDGHSAEEILNSLRAFRPTHAPSGGLGRPIVKSDTLKALEDKLFRGKRARELAHQIMETEREEQDEDEEEAPMKKIHIVKSAKPSRTFRSPQFYHSGIKTGSAEMLEQAAFDEHRLDLVPETEGDMQKARFAKKWDKRKMKYVTMRIGADGKAIKEKRNESGRKLSDKDNGKNLYKEWAKKTKKRIPKVGELESNEARHAGKKMGFEKDIEPTAKKPRTSGSNASSTTPPKAVKSKQYTGEVPWQYLTNKQKRLEGRKMNSGGVTSRGNEKRADTLKSATSIAKARKLKDTRKTLQNVKKRSEFHKTSRDAYAKKQQDRIKQRSAPARSWAKNRR